MSRTIDERVVEMRFDNAQFEANAGKSLTTLQRLREALNFSKSGESLEKLGEASKAVNSNNTELLNGVNALQRRFSVFGIMSMRAIENVTDSLMGLANRGVRAVTDSIVSGGIRRAMNIENAHFQLQALLKDEKKVQAVMDDAMKSVDGTAYAYDEAAKAASMFAATGIKAGPKMQRALRGIVGVAAMTNSSFESISQIFTNVAGNGRLMGDELLQLASRGLNAASTLSTFFNGVNDGSKKATKSVQDAIKSLTNGSKVGEAEIRELVSDGKISFEIFSEAMGEAFGDSAERANETFTGALSNIKSALARIGAGFVSPLVEQNSEVVLLFNAIREKVNDVKKALVFDSEIGNVNALSKQFTDAMLAMAKAANEFVTKADVTEPMTIFYHLVESTKNVVKGLGSVLTPISKAFSETFLSFSASDISEVTGKLEKFTKGLVLSAKGSDDLHDGFKGLFDIAKLLSDGFVNLLSAIFPMNKSISSIGSLLLNLFGDIGRGLTSFSEWVRTSEKLTDIYNVLSNVINYLTTKINGLTSAISKGSKGSSILRSMGNAMKALFKSIRTFDISPFTDMFSSLVDRIKESGGVVTKLLGTLANGILDLGKSATKGFRENGLVGIIDALNLLLASGIGVAITEFINNLSWSVSSGTLMVRRINGILLGVANSFKAFQAQINAQVLKTIATAIAILAASLFVLSIIDPERLEGSLTAVTVLLGELMGALTILTKTLNASGVKALGGLIVPLLAMATSVLILAAALKKLSNTDPEGIFNGLFAISVMLAELTVVSIALSRHAKKIKTGVLSILAFAASIYILSSSVKKLGELDTDTLKKGLLSVGALLAELSAFMIASKFGRFKASQAVGILILSAALLVLQKAVESFGRMDIDTTTNGLIAVGILLAELSAFTNLSGSAKHIIASSVSMILLAKALTMLTVPLKDIGSLNVDNIKNGLAGIGLMLGEIALAMRLMPKNSLMISTSLLLVAQAITMLSSALTKLGGFSWEQIGKSMSVLGISLGIMATAMNAMSGTIGGSISLLLMAAALNLIVPPLTTLGKMSWEAIGKGLIAIAGGFAILGAAAYLLTPVATQITMIVGVLSLFVMSLTGLVAALSALNLSSFVAGFAAPFMALGGILSLEFLKGVFGLIPDFFVGLINSVGRMVKALASSIAESMPVIADALTAIILSACEVINNCAPELVNTLMTLLITVLTSVANNAPELVGLLVKLITGVINALAEHIPEFIESIVGFFGQLFAGILSALAEFDMSVIIQNLSQIGMLAGLMVALSALASLAPSAMVGVLAFGALIGELSFVLAALGALNQIPGLDWLIGEGGQLLQSIGTAIGQFVGGILGGIAVGVSSQLVQIGQDLSAFMVALTPFLVGASSINEGTMSGVKSIAEVILMLTAADILKGLADWLSGGSSLASFASELMAFGPSIVAFASTVKDVDEKSVTGAANAARIMSETAKNLPNSGGLAAVLAGDNQLSEFGKQLMAFGPSIVAFASTVKDVDEKSVTGAASAGKIMAELAKTVPKSGGIASFFTGSSGNIKAFGSQLISFGSSIKAFAQKVEGISATSLTSLVKPIESLISLSKKAAKADASSLSTFVNGLGNIGSGGIESFANSLENGSTSAANAMGNVANASIKALTNKKGDFKKTGQNLAKEMINGLKALTSSATSAGKSLSTAALKGTQTNRSAFRTSGINAGKGYVEGLQSMLSRAREIGRRIAAESQKGTKAANKEHSPSKVFRQSGIFAGTGYVIGLAHMVAKAYKAGEDIALSSMSGTEFGIRGINRIFDDLSTDPVIRPRVDLSGVESSASGINSMFNDAINMTARTAGNLTVSTKKNDISDLAEAINGLSANNTNSGNIYNINGVSYSEGSDVATAIETLVHATTVQRRV